MFYLKDRQGKRALICCLIIETIFVVFAWYFCFLLFILGINENIFSLVQNEKVLNASADEVLD